MKAILALLLGISPFTRASSEVVSTFGSSLDEGLTVQVINDSDTGPKIAINKEDNTYCIYLDGLFEASQYNTTSTTNSLFTAINGTEIDFVDANCTITPETDSITIISCNDLNPHIGAVLSYTLNFTDNEEGGKLEYILRLEGYDLLSMNTSKLVMVLTTNCNKTTMTTEIPDIISTTSSGNDDDDDDDDRDRRRRMTDSEISGQLKLG